MALAPVSLFAFSPHQNMTFSLPCPNHLSGEDDDDDADDEEEEEEEVTELKKI